MREIDEPDLAAPVEIDALPDIRVNLAGVVTHPVRSRKTASWAAALPSERERTIRFLSVDEVEAIHQRLIDRPDETGPARMVRKCSLAATVRSA